jgi:pimeloyl-ACP methyl ester carboxylesterase
VSPAESGRVAARLPDARVVTIAGAGHVVHEEMPARVAEVIASA